MADLDAELDRATIPQLRERMAAGALSAVELTETYRERIRRLDPSVGAVLALDPTASAQARASDRRRAAARDRGPLDGIPVLAKDTMSVLAGFELETGQLPGTRMGVWPAELPVPPPEMK